uniref:Ribosomal protein L29 n=1 Tax=Rhodomela confervoides TaxID=35163 RepID=A0A1Z1M9F4_RHOCN|nr:ribosomal protein L29 [Rhodomela confervoides]ARW62738.1 ribosomal protein L29 [Rhodomela confervoides]
MELNTNANNLAEEVIELKKQLVFLRIKKVTRQKINTHTIKQAQHKISQILQLNRFNKSQNK